MHTDPTHLIERLVVLGYRVSAMHFSGTEWGLFVVVFGGFFFLGGGVVFRFVFVLFF